MNREAGSQGDLFPIPDLPSWLPGETLFSLISRYHQLIGNVTTTATSKILFGEARQGYQHDFPSAIGHFTEVTRHALGNTDDIIWNHTLLPFFLPFKDAQVTKDAVASMTSPHIGSLKYRLGILTSRFGANHPLKACPKCINADQENFSSSYWHIEHQIPGVWVCHLHKSSLQVSHLRSLGISRFKWFLPEKACLEPIPNEKALKSSESRLIAENALALFRLPQNTYFEPQRLLGTYRCKLDEAGYTKSTSSLNLKRLSKDYLCFCNQLTEHPVSEGLPNSLSDAESQIGRLLRLPRSGTHPLRHIILITWLFKHWDDFFDAYQTPCDVEQSSEAEEETSEELNAKKDHFLELVLDNNYSIRKAASIVGIDHSTGKGWARSVGLEICLKPKKLLPEKRKRLLKQIRSGIERKEIAKRSNLSVATVSRVIRSEIGLAQEWQDARFSLRQKKERETWKKLIQENPDLGIKALRDSRSSTYFWLYKNDRAWLEKINRKIPRTISGNNSSINWQARDNDFSQKIQKAVLEITKNNLLAPVTLNDILRHVPELNPKISRLNMMPLTRRALIKAVTQNNGAERFV